MKEKGNRRDGSGSPKHFVGTTGYSFLLKGGDVEGDEGLYISRPGLPSLGRLDKCT